MLAVWIHEVGYKTTNDETAGPSRVQNVEVVRLVGRKERGDEWIDDRVTNPVTDGEQEHPAIQAPEGGVFASRGKGNAGCQRKNGGCKMGQEGQGHQLAITDFVGDKRTGEDDQTRADETTPGDFPEIGHGESITIRPLAQDCTADGKTDPGGENRHESCPKQPLCIGGGDRFVAATAHC